MNIFEQLKNMLTGTPEVIPDNVVIIDVRSAAEYAGGHLQDAHLMPVDVITRQISTVVPNKETPIAVYCASGMRSASARAALLNMGYQTVINAGGLGGAAQTLNKPIV